MKKAKPILDPHTISFASGFKSRASHTRITVQPQDLPSHAPKVKEESKAIPVGPLRPPSTA